MRINKYIARSGFCSRREAENFIVTGQVTINGETVTSLHYQVEENDVVSIGSNILKHEETKLYMFYKPRSCLTSKSDPDNRALIYDHMPRLLNNLNPIGRLDFNSEGLLLLTNNGELKREYELPLNKFKRVYRVRFFGKLTNDNIKRIKAGLNIKGINYNVKDVILEKEGINSWCSVILTEGKNREIRNIFEYLNLSVNRLIRISYGEHKIGDLKPGEFTQISI